MDNEDIQLSRRLCDFIQQSPTAFHAVATIAGRMDAAGFVRLHEADVWHLQPGTDAYVVRNGSSLIAFRIGEQVVPDGYHLQMAAAHADSPLFKVKHVPELDGPSGGLRLNVEAYGGMIEQSWLDRPLGVAGRVLVRAGEGRIESRLVETDRDVAVIPSVAIHQQRELGKDRTLNRQVDLCPIFSAGALETGAFDQMVAELAGVEPDRLLGKDLYLYNRTAPRVWGWANEFVSAPRLDDLQCAFAAFEAFVGSTNPSCVSVYACFDNEEVGSGTRQGALSTFLHDTLRRMNGALGGTEQDLLRAFAQSLLVSCDNAHAVHPNHPELFDARNRTQLNGGVIVKEASNQKYTTDALGRAAFVAVCERAGVPVQVFANRSDFVGGSTLGNLSNQRVSVVAVDVGLPQLAMHSCFETAGVADTGCLARALSTFYGTDLRIDEGTVLLQG